MGQKVNPIIFQIGKTKKWQQTFLEKKNFELAKYSENQIEIKSFLTQYFASYNLKICDYNLFYADNTLTIFVSYFLLKQFFKNDASNKKKRQQSLKNTRKSFEQKFLLQKQYSKTSFFDAITRKKKTFYLVKKLRVKNGLTKKFFSKKWNLLKKNAKKKKWRPWFKKKHTPKRKFYKKKKRLIIVTRKKYKKKKKENFFKIFKKKKLYQLKKQKRFLKAFQAYKSLRCYNITKSCEESKIKNLNAVLTKSFLKKMFETIQLFNNSSSLKIICNFKQIDLNFTNSFTKAQFKSLKKSIGQLRRFNREKFFKEGVRTIIIFLKFPRLIAFFADYLALEMQKHKRQHHFLNFIQKGLALLNKAKAYPAQNIKIQIKGRFNGAPRSKKRVIYTGEKISVISLKSKTRYAESTSFSTDGGTFGIKIWTTNN